MGKPYSIDLRERVQECWNYLKDAGYAPD